MDVVVVYPGGQMVLDDLGQRQYGDLVQGVRMTMSPQKVVLSDRLDGSEEEVKIGPFTQGVVIDKDESKYGGTCLRDVASGRTLALLSSAGHKIVAEDGSVVRSSTSNGVDLYGKVFIQTYPDGGS